MLIFMKTEDKKYYDYLVKRSKLSFTLRKFMYKSIAKEFRGKVLDVGCGLGEFLELYKNSYGIDSNKYAVDYCKSNNLRCFVGSAYKIPFRSSSFDVVLCSHLIEHLKRPEIALKEFRRVLKPSGKLIIIVPTKTGYKRDKTHVKYWKESELIDILESFNFKIKKVSYYPVQIRGLRDMLYINELRVIATK